jgi:transglutaminase-like putative cysteine protease
LALVAFLTVCSPLFAAHAEAPAWMHALVGVPLPAHDEKDKAVLLYREESLTVVSTDKFRSTVREVYKILRPEGREFGLLGIPFNSLNQKITSIHAWCIPASGKDYEVTDKDAVEVSPLKGDSSDLVTDERIKGLEIPAPDPGNIIGYEYVMEERPLVLQDAWDFQETVPVRESHYSLNLPPGWEFKDAWVNYAEVKPHDAGGGVWQWSLADLKEIRVESDMPPWRGVAGRMVLSLFPPGGAAANSLPTWHDVGMWETHLTNGRVDASPEIKQEVSSLTAAAPTPLAKMRALADFMQRNIRYVAIELGIGGFQPHPAPQVFEHRYGDCKDKATLMRSMLHEAGIESYYVVIHHERGSVTPETPAYMFAFDHVIVAIKLPDGLTDPSLVATVKHPTLGTLLFYDPTSEKTPFGQIPEYLQANYGLLVAPSGGELVELPQQPSALSGIQRVARLKLSISGDLEGDVQEVRVGDWAAGGREAFNSVQKESDRIKPIESLLANSLPAFHLTNANAANVKETDSPFIWNYTFRADQYAKYAGNLILVRPRVLGQKARATLETPEPRRYPIEFDGPERDTDNFEITLPSGYAVDDLPPAVDADFPFASYHSKTEVVGNVLRYHRTFEVKQLSVPASDAPQLKKFYRIIASDERNTAVLKLGSP